MVGAGEGNRTLVVSLEGFCSTIELHPHTQSVFLHHNITKIQQPHILKHHFTKKMKWWRRLDSNQRRRKPTGLQPVPFSHSGTPPLGSPTHRFTDDNRGWQYDDFRHYVNLKKHRPKQAFPRIWLLLLSSTWQACKGSQIMADYVTYGKTQEDLPQGQV